MSIETRDLHKEALKEPEKISDKKIEQFIQKALPGIYDRTKDSGHFRNVKTHELISLSEMSDNISEDAYMYQKFKGKLENILIRAERKPYLIGESDVRDIHAMFKDYGKGRESGKIYYFVEYLKNKSAIVAAALELTLDGSMSKERFAHQLRRILSELTGKSIEIKKKKIEAISK